MSPANTPVLLLRGLSREQRHWGSFISQLQQQLPATPVLTLDLPGNGVCYQHQSPSTIQEMTEAVRQQWFAGGQQVPVNLLTLSMGGMLAIDWMTRYPHEIASGVVINASLSNFSPFYRRLRWQNYGAILRFCCQSLAQREQTILALTSNEFDSDAQLLSQWIHWQQQQPVSFANTLRQLSAAARFKPQQQPTPPLLVIASQADRLVDYRCSLAIHQAWQTALRIHPSAGHDLPLDDPGWLSEVIQEWLQGLAE